MFVKGYASLFNEADLGGDIILPGAFDACLSKRPIGDIKMLYHHDVRRPIGVWRTIKSTAKGLWVYGELTTDARLGHDAAALVKSRALDGLSIGFRAIKARRLKAGRRHIHEIDLLEISLVTFPMQPKARLAGSTITDAQNFVSVIANATQEMVATNSNHKGKSNGNRTRNA
ncbi:MAG: HK97 family phage prohead protease [Alphaproteobacteria bacterium]|nr:HK97 family phage prohead protease [Alphaproteobacteria bacterium]